MILPLEPLFVSVSACTSVWIWGDDEAGLSRERITLSSAETYQLERETIAPEAEAPQRCVYTSWDHGMSEERRQAHRLIRQARQVQRPAIDLQLRSASLIELFTSYFVLLGAGAMRGKGAHAFTQILAFATRGKPGPFAPWPRFRGFFLYSSPSPAPTRPGSVAIRSIKQPLL